MDKRQDEILINAITTYGEDQQIEMIIEECAELIHALQRYKRDSSTERRNNVCEEVADVKIMIHQAEHIFSKELINTYKESKINRLNYRLHNEGSAA